MPSHRSGAINWPHSLTSTIKWSGRLEIGSLYSEALLLDLLRRPITCRKLMVNKAIKPRIQEVIEIKLFQLIVKSCWKDFRFVVICGWWMKRWIKEWLPRIKAAILGGNVRGRGSWPYKITENYFNGNELNFLLITVWGKSKSVHSPWDYFNTAIKSVDTDFKWWSF